MSASLTESDLGVVYMRARPGMIRLAVLLLNDLAAAEDVVQDVFARVHQKQPSVDSLERYLTTAVLNTARSALRRRRVAANALVRLRTREPVSEPGADELTPEQHRVWAAITGLPFRQRQVVVCRFYLDLTERDTAQTLGVSLSTVKTCSSRAMTALARSLGDHDG